MLSGHRLNGNQLYIVIKCLCDDKSFFGKTYTTEYWLVDALGAESETLRMNFNFLYVIEQFKISNVVEDTEYYANILGTLEERHQYWKRRSGVQAYIKSIDNLGLMTVEFDKKLHI